MGWPGSPPRPRRCVSPIGVPLPACCANPSVLLDSLPEGRWLTEGRGNPREFEMNQTMMAFRWGILPLVAAFFLFAASTAVAQEENDEAPAEEQEPEEPEQTPDEEAPAEEVVAEPVEPERPGLGEYDLTVDPTSRILRLHPRGHPTRQDHTVTVGQEFLTDVSFRNESMLPFDMVRIFLSYNPEIFRPVAINDRPLADNLKGEPTAEVDDVFGMILYEAELEEPLASHDAPILTIRWEAQQLTVGSRIVFSSRDEFFTALVGEGRDLVGHPRVPGDGTLGMTVTVLPEDEREAQAMLSDPRLYTGTDEKIGGVLLRLVPQEEPIVAGEPFHIDVVLDNRAFSMVDGLSFLISYDPEIIEIIDADQDNWITRGTNILDGKFRGDYPWAFHIDNTVDRRRGTIHYKKGTHDPEMTRGRVGTVARIYAVAHRPTRGTAFRFEFSKRPRAQTTQAVYNGINVLGDLQIPDDGATGIAVRVGSPTERNRQNQE